MGVSERGGWDKSDGVTNLPGEYGYVNNTPHTEADKETAVDEKINNISSVFKSLGENQEVKSPRLRPLPTPPLSNQSQPPIRALPSLPSIDQPKPSGRPLPSLPPSVNQSAPPSRAVPQPPQQSAPNISVMPDYGTKIQDRLLSSVRESNYEKNGGFDVNPADIKSAGSELNVKILLPVPDFAYDQGNLVSEVRGNKEYKTLSKITARFDGLCDIICNKVLIENLMEKVQSKEELENKLNIEEINTKQIKNSHILHVMPAFKIMVAVFSKIYPDNIFTYKEQSKLVEVVSSGRPKTDRHNGKKAIVNKEILQNGLNRIPSGETLKMEVFRKKGLDFAGHSLLIKKVKDNEFVFFNPDGGIYKGLTFDQLKEEIDRQLLANDGTDLLFMKGSDYLKRLGVKAK